VKGSTDRGLFFKKHILHLLDQTDIAGRVHSKLTRPVDEQRILAVPYPGVNLYVTNVSTNIQQLYSNVKLINLVV